MDEKTLPVVPSSWEATGVFRAATGVAAAPQRGANSPFATEGGCGVVEKNNDITYYKLNI